MKTGAWHQFGHNDHKTLVRELLAQDVGVGVILSPRDLTLANAVENIADYKTYNAEVLLDPQWYIPSFTNSHLKTYETGKLRQSVSKLKSMSASQMTILENAIYNENLSVFSDAVIAPAVLYKATDPDVIRINKQLHEAACAAAKRLSVARGKQIDCYATVILDISIINNPTIISQILSEVTRLSADGWYFGAEFNEDRLPLSSANIFNCLHAMLTLACTTKPVMHAFAGPMGIMSIASGCTAAATGPSKKQWQFLKERWAPPKKGGGGGGKHPARYFSESLWGTIVFPDETVNLPAPIASKVFAKPTPFAQTPLTPAWHRPESNHHLQYAVCSAIQAIANQPLCSVRYTAAKAILQNAIATHDEIKKLNFAPLRDSSNLHQKPWLDALDKLHTDCADDFNFLAMI